MEELLELKKMEIKNAYNDFLENNNIKPLAKLFNIYLDDKGKYEIKAINYEGIPEIQIIDKESNTLYKAEYSRYADILKSKDFSVSYNNVTIELPNFKIARVYYLFEEQPIKEELSINNGEYIVKFEREMFNPQDYKIKLLKVSPYSKDIGIDLFEKEYKTQYNNRGQQNFYYEDLFTNNESNISKDRDTQHYYAYQINGNIIYGTNILKSKSLNFELYGACFENAKLFEGYYLPINLHEYDKDKEINNIKTNSTLIYKGFLNNTAHRIKVIKNGKNIIIDYNINDYKNDKKQSKRFVITGDNCLITPEELNNLLYVLNEKYPNNIFIKGITMEINRFKNKIAQKQEELDIINPRYLENKSIVEMYEEIIGNEEDIINKMIEEYDRITNITEETLENSQEETNDKPKIIVHTITNKK